MRNIFLILLGVTLFTACKNNEEKAADPAAPIDHQQAVHPENVGDLDDIELNNGDLWQVDTEISDQIRMMDQTLESSSPQTVEDYRALGNDLKEQKTMLDNQRQTGKEYDSNLNLYLGPLEENINKLQNVDSIEEGERLTSSIEQNLQTYSSYFQ